MDSPFALNNKNELERLALLFRPYDSSRLVLKMGGSLTDNKAAVRSLAEDILCLAHYGILPVLVNGGGKAINRATGNDHPIKIAGYRVTDEKTAGIIDDVLFEVSSFIAGQIRDSSIHLNKDKAGFGVVTLHGREIFRCKPREVFLDNGEKANLQFVGKITDVNSEIILQYLHERKIPVISSTALGEDGKIYNCNADDAAASLAAALKARRLIFLTEAAGILDVNGNVCHRLTREQVVQMLKSGELSQQIWPKLEGVLAALEQNVAEVSVIDGRLEHAVFTDFAAEIKGEQFGSHFSA